MKCKKGEYAAEEQRKINGLISHIYAFVPVRCIYANVPVCARITLGIRINTFRGHILLKKLHI